LFLIGCFSGRRLVVIGLQQQQHGFAAVGHNTQNDLNETPRDNNNETPRNEYYYYYYQVEK